MRVVCGVVAFCVGQSLESATRRHDNYVTYRIARGQVNLFDSLVLRVVRFVCAAIRVAVNFRWGRSAKVITVESEDPSGEHPKIDKCMTMGQQVEIVVDTQQPARFRAVLDPGLCVAQPIVSAEAMKGNSSSFAPVGPGNSFHSSEGCLSHTQCSAGETAVYRCASEPVSSSITTASPALNSEQLRKRWRTSLLSRRSMDMESASGHFQEGQNEDDTFAMSAFPVFVMSCVQPGGFFDGKASRVKAAHHRSHAASVLFSRSSSSES